MVEKIEECCSSSSSVNLSQVLMKLANDVVCRVALGRKYSDGEDGKKFKKLLGDFVELLGCFFIGDYIPWLSWLRFVNGFDGKLKKVAKEFDGFLEKVVQEHVDDYKKREIKEDYKDFADILLHVQNENLLIDRVFIKAIILLLRHPNIMRKLQAEIRSIAGSKTHITEDNLEGMVYLKAVIKETLRLHPAVPLIPRVSRTQVEINGYEIQPGCHVYINAWAIGRDPISWESPEEFNPYRFLKSDVDDKAHDFRLIPFGSGRRGCPGIQFAMAVIEIALANLIHRFDWGLPCGERGEDLDISETFGLGIHKKFPLIAVPALCDIRANN
ncbi:hypothetical protein FEM48_Zijuj05G0062400 [Ziziphus jujuba var. spinosa]|uniref:Cytochrome P450 71A1-like n=1 Tax=Ziziphus jujuba var. spinosa TaxID=714518 RepID=A0A978VDA2_ZIZJJ|nr:hypothetical protein FEM48_Zijuj05G0062400 [Ziziphus jujuba var. spinosa]